MARHAPGGFLSILFPGKRLSQHRLEEIGATRAGVLNLDLHRAADCHQRFDLGNDGGLLGDGWDRDENLANIWQVQSRFVAA